MDDITMQAVEGVVEGAISWPVKFSLPVSLLGFKTRVSVTITQKDFEAHAGEFEKLVTALVEYFSKKA